MLLAALKEIIEDRRDGKRDDAEDAQRACQQNRLHRVEAHIAIFAFVKVDQQPGDPPEEVAEPSGGLGGNDERGWPPGRRGMPRRVRDLWWPTGSRPSHHRHDMRYRPLLPSLLWPRLGWRWWRRGCRGGA